jgi:hypothetical protein
MKPLVVFGSKQPPFSKSANLGRPHREKKDKESLDCEQSQNFCNNLLKGPKLEIFGSRVFHKSDLYVLVI